MAQIEGAYLHQKYDGVEYAIALYDDVSDVGDCYVECAYWADGYGAGTPVTAYMAATEDQTSEAYQKYGTPQPFHKPDGTTVWLLTEPYVEDVEELYLNILGDLEVPVTGGTYTDEDLMALVDTNAASVAFSKGLTLDTWCSYADGVLVVDSNGLSNGGFVTTAISGDIIIGGDVETYSRTAYLTVVATGSDGSTLTGTMHVVQAGTYYEPYYEYTVRSAFFLSTEFVLNEKLTANRDGDAPTLTAKVQWYAGNIMTDMGTTGNADGLSTYGFMLTVIQSGELDWGMTLVSPLPDDLTLLLSEGDQTVRVEVTIYEDGVQASTYELEDTMAQIAA